MTTQAIANRISSTYSPTVAPPRLPILPDVRLLLICHAEDMHDVYRDLSHENSGLTALGWAQSDTLATWLLNHERIDILVSGPHLHSRLTAQRIGQTLGLPVKVNKNLPRCIVSNWHFWDGEPTVSAGQNGATEAPSPPDEYVDFHRALGAAIDQIVSESAGKTVAIVTCNNSIATIVRHFAGGHRLGVQVDHTGVTELRRYQDQWQLRYSNRREHLPAGQLAPDVLLNSAPKVAQTDEDLSQVTAIYDRVSQADLNRKAQDDTRRLRHLLDFVQLPPGKVVLDVGTGVGILALMLADDGAEKVVGIDVSPGMLERAEYARLHSPSAHTGRVSYRLASAQILPFSDGDFDAVVCRLVMHHSRAPECIVREAVRVLKPGGVFVLADLLGDDDPVKRATQDAIEVRRNPTHTAARTSEEYKRLVADAGLTVQATEQVSFKRELEEWLYAMQADPTNGSIVREMIEAGLETDAAGLNARHQDGVLYFSQRVLYIKAVK